MATENFKGRISESPSVKTLTERLNDLSELKEKKDAEFYETHVPLKELAVMLNLVIHNVQRQLKNRGCTVSLRQALDSHRKIMWCHIDDAERLIRDEAEI